MASLGGTQLKRIQSGRDHCFGGASLQRLASHIGRPRFNALARLASSALRSSVDSRPVTTACAAVAARPAAQQAPVEVRLTLLCAMYPTFFLLSGRAFAAESLSLGCRRVHLLPPGWQP